MRECRGSRSRKCLSLKGRLRFRSRIDQDSGRRLPNIAAMSSRDRPRPAASDSSEESALIHAHIAAIAWIEAHLFEPMTVKSIADHAGYSPSRFSRGFTRLQGESVM